MPQCDLCGSFVTHDFARVFGDNTANVNGCLHCAAIGEHATPGGGRGSINP